MTSGVYKLTFSNGDTYIGKSVDIAIRWKQHFDKFQKGTAAKAMQAAYNRYGAPDGEVAFACHEDHIDIVEACLINRLKPTLNGTYPKDPFAGIYNDDFDNLLEFLKYSTVEHIRTINTISDKCTEAESEAKTLEELNKSMSKRILELKKQRSEEEVTKDINKRIRTLMKEKENLVEMHKEAEAMNGFLQKELAYHRLPWWKKIF